MHGAGGCFFLSLLRGGMIDSLLTWGLSVFLLEHLLRFGSSYLLKDPSPSGSKRSSPSIIEERPGSCSEDFFYPRRTSWVLYPDTIYLCPVYEQLSFGVFSNFWEEIGVYCGRFLSLPGSPQRACPRRRASWMFSPYTIFQRPLHPGRASGLLI